jgi:hypothetical protein
MDGFYKRDEESASKRTPLLMKFKETCQTIDTKEGDQLEKTYRHKKKI